MMARWVVWSEEHKQWWGAGGWGYTPSLRLAGRYTETEAKAIADKANRYLPPVQARGRLSGTFNEVAMPDPLESA
jgi:hypothetical protein